MIHHISLPAKKPSKVAKALVRLFQGELTDFTSLKNAYMFWLGDEYGTAVEIYPHDVTLRPGNSKQPCRFKHNDDSRYNAVHVALSCDLNTDEIAKIADDFGWHSAEFSRGSFRVVEFWIENSFMLELLTPEMTDEYLKMAKKHMLGKTPGEVPCLAGGIKSI